MRRGVWVGIVAIVVCIVVAAGIGFAVKSGLWQASVMSVSRAFVPATQPRTQVVQSVVKETVVVKQTVEVPKEVTKIVEKEVRVPVTVTQLVTVVVQAQGTPVPVMATAFPVVVTTTTVSSAITPSVLSVSTCRHIEWLISAMKGTTSVAEFVAVLDRDFVKSEGGEWTERGVVIPANRVFWTDLFQNAGNLPAGVYALRTQGGWGVYYTTVAYTIPAPNGGGRYMNMCEELSSLRLRALVSASPVPAQPAAVASSASVVTATVAPTQVFTCITRVEMGVILGKSDFVKEYNSFFEGRGYLFGGSLNKGDMIPAGSFFLGTFNGDGPAAATNLKGGSLWEITIDGIKADNGGRWMKICSK